MERVNFILTTFLLSSVVNTSTFLVIFIAIAIVLFLLGLILGLSLNTRKHITKEMKAPFDINNSPTNITPNTTTYNNNTNNGVYNNMQQNQIDTRLKGTNEKKKNILANYKQWPYSAENFNKNNRR